MKNVIWEYLVDSFEEWNEREAAEYLSKKGAEGWELVHVSHSLRTFFFKRPKR